MKMQEIFKKPIDRNIDGVIKADQRNSLDVEFSEFVVTGEIDNRLTELFEIYDKQKPDFNGVWISGFFGSGKSHLLKILSYLLPNEEIHEGKKAIDYFDAKLRDDPMLMGQMKKAVAIPSESIIFNIMQKDDSSHREEESSLLPAFLRVFNDHCGYYGKIPIVAELERQLDSEGLLGKFKQALKEKTGKDWEDIRRKPNVKKKEIAEAFSTVTDQPYDINLLDSIRMPQMAIADFCDMVKDYIDQKGKDFRLNFFVDEVGQFVAGNNRLMLSLQEIASGLSSCCNNQSWLFVTSQDEMAKFVSTFNEKAAMDFSKIQGRFQTRLSLSNKNVNEVIQKRLLEKNDAGKASCKAAYSSYESSFSTLFDFVNGPKKYSCFKDEDSFIQTYPFIPYQFDMFKDTLESLSDHMAFSGMYTSTGARSMLDVFHMVLIRAKFRDRTAGDAVVPYDAMYDGLEKLLLNNFKSSIDKAEQNILDDDFAIRVLKALLLVKYLKHDFKPTMFNISVLMMENLSDNPKTVQDNTQRALDRLEKETYIQRNGDEYDFLTNEEKDVEEEIKRESVTQSDLSDYLKQVIYDSILQNMTKIHCVDYSRDFVYMKKIDGEAVAPRNSDLGLNVITSFGGNVGDRALSESVKENDLVVAVMDNGKLVDDVRLFKQTELYVKKQFGDQPQEDRKKVLDAKQERNKERDKEIRGNLKEWIMNAPLYFHGSEIGLKPSSDPRCRIESAFQDVIQSVFYDLKMIGHGVYSENSVKDALEPKEQSEFFEKTSEAENQILNAVKNNLGVQSNIQKLILEFSQKPYGWPEMGILTFIARLCFEGKVEIKLDGKELGNKALCIYLLKTSQQPSMVVSVVKQVNPKLLKQLRDFLHDFDGYHAPADDARSLVETTNKKLSECKGEIAQALQGKTYPFSDSLKQFCCIVDGCLSKDNDWYFTVFLKDFCNTLLNQKEDFIDPCLKFLNDTKRRGAYDDAKDFIDKNVGNISALTDSCLKSSIEEILGDHDIYKGGTALKLPDLCDSMQHELSTELNKKKQKSLEILSGELGIIANDIQLGETVKKQISVMQETIGNELSQCDSLAEYANVFTFKVQPAIEEAKKIAEQAKQQGNRFSDKKLKVDDNVHNTYVCGRKSKKMSELYSVKTNTPIKTEVEVDIYLQNLKQEMVSLIHDGYEIEQ